MREATWALVLLTILSAVAVTAGVIALADEPSNVTGEEHAQLKSLEIGGPGAKRHEPIMAAGWLLGTLILTLIVALMAFAYRGRLKVVGPPLAVALGIQIAIYTAMMLSYARQLDASSSELVLAFPVPTAWLLYGLWASKLLFVVIFVVTFDSAYWRPQDQAVFERLLAQRGRAT